MRPPTASAMLAAWERGLDQDPVERGLTLLALACPEADREGLAELSIGERGRRLLALRGTVFGPHLTGLIDCEACGETLELDIAAADLSAAPRPDAAGLAVCISGYALELRLPDSRDLAASAAADPTAAKAVLLRRCIVAASCGGQALETQDLPADTVDAIARRLSEADPQADLHLALVCAGCGHQWRAAFDIVPFLWTELDAWAARALQEVHFLAAAYGWSERDILGLGPARRRRYLRMLGA
jgi:hypothetical protein